MDKPHTETTGWRRVQTPSAWRPVSDGQELQGVYVGRVARRGANSVYTSVLVQTETGLRTVSGCVLLSLFDALVCAQPGTHVRIVFRGRKQSNISGRVYKDFELYVRAPLTPAGSSAV